MDVTNAHTLNHSHRPILEASAKCGCYYCCIIFTPKEINEWINERVQGQQTALYPFCSIDAVIPETPELCRYQVQINLHLKHQTIYDITLQEAPE